MPSPCGEASERAGTRPAQRSPLGTDARGGAVPEWPCSMSPWGCVLSDCASRVTVSADGVTSEAYLGCLPRLPLCRVSSAWVYLRGDAHVNTPCKTRTCRADATLFTESLSQRRWVCVSPMEGTKAVGLQLLRGFRSRGERGGGPATHRQKSPR